MAREWTGDAVSAEFRAFWTERHLASLVTLRADGTPHVVPVGVTLDLDADPPLARVICRWTGHADTLIQLEGHGREDLFDAIDLLHRAQVPPGAVNVQSWTRRPG